MLVLAPVWAQESTANLFLGLNLFCCQPRLYYLCAGGTFPSLGGAPRASTNQILRSRDSPFGSLGLASAASSRSAFNVPR